MDTDLFFVLGGVLFCLALPIGASAYSDGRTPRAAAVMVAIGGSMLLVAMMLHPDGYSFSDYPEAFFRVLARFF